MRFWGWIVELCTSVGYMHAFRQALPSHTKLHRLQKQEAGASFRADSVEPRIRMSSLPIYFVKERNLAHICIFFFFHLVHEWKVIYLLILVMMQNGPDVYMRLYVSCFVNMRLFFCNKSGLNINYSGLILPLWTKQRFCFSATVFQNQVLVSVSVVGNKKRARKKTEL